MRVDTHLQTVLTEEDLFQLLMRDPERHIAPLLMEQSMQFASEADVAATPHIQQWRDLDALSQEQFDALQQSHWYMPQRYRDLDIAQYVLSRCQNDAQLQRVGQELLLYQERNAFDLLRYCVYLVDMMRKHNVVWGVGRGSSVASYVLFLIGIHKIDSMFYDLDPNEFLR